MVVLGFIIKAISQNEPAEEANEPDVQTCAENFPQWPDALTQIANEFPFSRINVPRDQLFEIIAEQLPSYERATALIEAYLENGDWFPRPIQRDQIMEELMPFVYRNRRTDWLRTMQDEENEFSETHNMHNLALALGVFACGAASDLTQLPTNAEGTLYRRLALAILGDHSIFNSGASLETVQAVILVAQYDFFACTNTSMETSWKIFQFGLILAVSVSHSVFNPMKGL